MKNRYPNGVFNSSMLRNAWLVLAVLAGLQGCASDKPTPAIVTTTQAVSQTDVISAETRADFDAAMQLIKKEEYEKAIELLNKVVKAAPKNAIASINLALAYKKLGKLKQAEDSLKLAFIAEPGNPVAHNEYALLYRKTGRFSDARTLYEKILDKYPNFNIAHKNLGILCDLYMKDYQCALNHYVIYSDAMPDDKTAKIWIADVKRRLGR